MSDLLTLLAAPFVQRAFLIGILIALLSSLLSVFIVLKNVSLIGDGLAHTAFGGLAIGYYVGVVPAWSAAALVVLGSMGITKLNRSAKIPSDAAVAVFLTLGLASGILFYQLGRGFGVNLESLLFGSILLATVDQLVIALVVLATTVAGLLISFSKLVYTTFNETQAQAAGIRTWVYDYWVSILAGIAVVVSIPIAGILLIAALLVLPGLTSIQVAHSFRQTMILSPVFGLLSVVAGIFFSLVLDVAPGAAIVLTGLGILTGVVALRKLAIRLAREGRGSETPKAQTASGDGPADGPQSPYGERRY
jgi:zinc transport system permease protein